METIKNGDVSDMRLAYSILDQAVTSGGNFLVIAICAHLLSVDEQGKVAYTYATYLAVLLLNIAIIFQGAAIKAPSVKNANVYHRMLARLQLMSGVTLCVIAVFFWWGFGDKFDWAPSRNELILFFLYLFTQQLADFERRTSYIFFGPGRAAVSSIAVYPIRVLSLLLFLPDTFEMVVAIWAVTAIVPALFSIIRAVAGRRDTWQFREMIHHIFFSKLMIAGAPLGWLWSFLPIFFLGGLLGKVEVAVFMSIRSIANVANLAMEQLEIQAATHMSRTYYTHGKSSLDRTVVQLLFIGGSVWIVGLLVTFYFSEDVVGLVLGANYVQHSGLLTVSWVAFGVYFFARVYAIARRTVRDMKTEFVGNMVAVVTAIGAGFPLVNYFGMYGAAWAYVVIAASIGIAQALIVRNMCHE